uniref:Promyelocytic leukemia n=1 Tax=Jaculus jaculus TaxID=51337 RepID=A0A8C5JZJ4_JACJA
PAPSRSPSFQQASTLLPTPTVPPPDPPCDGHEPSHNHSPAEARLLALNNVSFLELLTAYRGNPQQALKKYGRYLSLQTTSSSVTRPSQYLRALSTYLDALSETPALAQAEGISTPCL